MSRPRRTATEPKGGAHSYSSFGSLTHFQRRTLVGFTDENCVIVSVLGQERIRDCDGKHSLTIRLSWSQSSRLMVKVYPFRNWQRPECWLNIVVVGKNCGVFLAISYLEWESESLESLAKTGVT